MEVKIQGNTAEEKFASLERILTVMRRQLGNKIVGLIPPVPVIDECPMATADGILCTKIIPFNGTTKSVALHFGELLDKSSILTLRLRTADVSVSADVICDSHDKLVSVEWPIREGNIVEVRVNPWDGVKDVLVGFSVMPDLSYYGKEEQLTERVAQLQEIQDAASGTPSA